MKSKLFVIAAIGSLLLSSCAKVETRPLAEPEHYALSLTLDDGGQSFNDFQLSRQADKTCPKGYEFISQSLYKKGQLPVDGASCLTGENCLYQLQWRIVCVDKPREPWSLFGKH